MENGQVKETLKFSPQKGQIKISIFPCRIRRILETFCSPGIWRCYIQIVIYFELHVHGMSKKAMGVKVTKSPKTLKV